MLGLERYESSGALGSGTTGYGRIWRYMHTEERYAHMMEEAVQIFKEIETLTGKQILTYGGLLYMKKPESEDFK